MRFFLPCIPPKVSQNSRKIIRRGRFSSIADSERLAAGRSDLLTLLAPHVPPVPLDGPLFLELIFWWPFNAGDTKRARQAGWCWHAVKPDADNASKLMTDCMARCGFFVDDSRVVRLSVEKFRTNSAPGISVLLEVLEDTNDRRSTMAKGHAAESPSRDPRLAAGQPGEADQGGGGGLG